jgi:hypothetical protein
MQTFLFRLVGYSILFLISIFFVNVDHATPGLDEPAIEAPFWATYKLAYALGFAIAIGGFFEKSFAEKFKTNFPYKSWFVFSSLIFVLLAVKLQSDDGQLQLEYWYTYFVFFIYGFLLFSIYSDIVSKKKKE